MDLLFLSDVSLCYNLDFFLNKPYNGELLKLVKEILIYSTSWLK